MAGPVPAIHVLASSTKEDVDARDKPGHDGANIDQRDIVRLSNSILVIARRLSPARSGMTGRSSIPEAAVIEPKRRCILDAPLSRSMTAE
jgi:hypothetical protein